MKTEDATIEVPISREQLIRAVKKMNKNTKEAFIEDLIASVSPKYLDSIKDAREDYRKKRVYSHKDAFSE